MSTRPQRSSAVSAAECLPAPVGVSGVESVLLAASMPPSIRPRAGGSSNSDSEVYGFVLWLSSFVLLALYLLWAFVPDAALHRLGWTYYPSRWWAVALPAYFLMAILFVPIVYFSWNLSATQPLDHRASIRDGWTRQQQRDRRADQRATDAAAAAMDERKHEHVRSVSDAAYSIEEIADVPIERVNQILYAKRRTKK